MSATSHLTGPTSETSLTRAAPSPAATSHTGLVQRKDTLRGKSFDEQARSLEPVQLKGEAEGQVHEAAARGTAGAGGSLPHADRIQAAFGRHDVSNVQAYTGGAAREASAAMGARAFATGDKVAFGESADLHTAAHEAAHVVQQRAGVSLAGGVGQSGDAYEQHADAVADAVVQGKSAESVLDTMAGGGPAVQRREVHRGAVQARALPSWLPGVSDLSSGSQGEPVQMDFKDDMKDAQKQSYDGAAPAALAARLTTLYAYGYTLQNNSGRIVYSKQGTFADTKTEVVAALGVALGDNKIPAGGAAKANDGVSPRELYAASVDGCTCNVRNFGSQAAARGTIEIHVAGLILEFKNVT